MPRRLRKRDNQRRGHKWVDNNYDVKKELKDNNGGTMPFTPAFTTSRFEGCDQWNETSPPDILFYLQPPSSNFEDHEPQPALDDEARVIMSPYRSKQELRNIPVLPDRISVDVPGWMMVAWRRIDPRIRLQDIVDRMTTDLGEAEQLTDKLVTIPKKNSMQHNCTRNCRKLLRYYNDYGRRQEPHRAEVEAMEGLTMNNIRYNTILQYHPEFHRLIKVKFVRKDGDGTWHVEQMDVTEENLEETTYPVDYFVFEDYNPDLSDNMSKAIMTLWTVQERAAKHGLDPSHWNKLKRPCLPSSWFDRTKEKKESTGTYDGGCEVCTWKSATDNDWEGLDRNKAVRRTPRAQKIKAEIKVESVKRYSHKSGGKSSYEGVIEWQDVNDPFVYHTFHIPEKKDAGYRHSIAAPHSANKRRMASQASPVPLKRHSPTHQCLNNALKHSGGDPTGVHALNAGQSQPIDNVRNRADGTQTPTRRSCADAPRMRDFVSYPEDDLSDDGCMEPEQVLPPLSADFRGNITNLPEDLDDRLRSSLYDFATQQLEKHQTDEAGQEDLGSPLYTDYKYSKLVDTDPMLSSTAVGLGYDDPDLAVMIDLAQNFATSPRQPMHLGLVATGVG